MSALCPIGDIAHAWLEGKRQLRRPKQEAPPGYQGSISGMIPLHAKLIPVTTNSTDGRRLKLPHTQKLNWITLKIQKGPVRGFTCLITNDATPKQIAAVKLIDSKGSHVTT
jgi:hypothetical protein